MDVVGVAIVRGGRVLAARRAPGRAGAHPVESGGWELPGGKCLPGEPLAAAAVREVMEELGCVVRVTRVLDHAEPVDDRLTLRAVVAELVAGEPLPQVHDAVRWLAPDQLHEVDWLPADVPFTALVGQLLRGGDAGPSGRPAH